MMNHNLTSARDRGGVMLTCLLAEDGGSRQSSKRDCGPKRADPLR